MTATVAYKIGVACFDAGLSYEQTVMLAGEIEQKIRGQIADLIVGGWTAAGRHVK